MPAISGQKRLRGRGSPTVNRTARRVRPELGQRHGTQPRNQRFTQTGVRILSGRERARHRCCRSRRHGPRVQAGPACRRAEAAIREGGVAATAFGSNATPQLNKSEGQAVSMRHRIANRAESASPSRRRITMRATVAGAWRRRVKSRVRMLVSA